MQEKNAIMYKVFWIKFDLIFSTINFDRILNVALGIKIYKILDKKVDF